MRWHSFGIVAAAVLATMVTRYLPFLIFSEKRKTPAIIIYLGKVLPCAIMGMLVVYCLKDVQFTSGSFGISEILACCAVVGLHVWKRNSLLSIGAGTALYMVLIQLVF